MVRDTSFLYQVAGTICTYRKRTHGTLAKLTQTSLHFPRSDEMIRTRILPVADSTTNHQGSYDTFMKGGASPLENILGVVCGLDSTTQCGESMFSKVTTWFGGSNGNAKDDNSSVAGDDTPTTGPDNSSDSTGSKVSSPKSPKKIPSLPDDVCNSPTTATPSNTANDNTRSLTPKSPKSPLLPVASPKSPQLVLVDPDVKNDDPDDDDDDDVDAMLANLEIPDFDMSLTEIRKEQPVEPTQTLWEDVDWDQRINREEIYSRRYRPSKTEVKELEAMANVLGLAKGGDLVAKLMSMTMGKSARIEQDIRDLFFGEHSILLSVLPVQCNSKRCDLVILTDGFVLKYHTFNAYNPLEKRYETGRFWDSVEYCERSSLFSIAIQADASTRIELESVDGGESLDTIFKRLERVIAHRGMFNSQKDHTLGWQYHRIRKPAFTAAITGNAQLLASQQAAQGINELDAYNGYAPLHYAVLQEEVNAEVIKGLLKAGADPNLVDGDERSPMYYAERNEAPEEILQILKSGGGKKSKLAEMEMRGELFSGVNAANEKSKERRERERQIKEQEQALKDQKAAEAKAKAEGAQSEMSKAMSALIERGEKIEQMDQKTKELQAEAKTFGDLASRLKEEVKNKKWYKYQL